MAEAVDKLTAAVAVARLRNWRRDTSVGLLGIEEVGVMGFRVELFLKHWEFDSKNS